ncbi:MAG: hypothetical protein RIT51_929, partial [Actinomycetota bacterium]
MTQSRKYFAGLAALIGSALAIWLGMTFTGAGEAAEIADPGAFVRWAAPLAKGATNIALAATVGTLVLAAWALPDGSKRLARALNFSAVAGMLWVLFGSADIVLRFASISDLPLSASPKFSAGLWQFITEVPLGQALVISLAMALVAATGAMLLRSLRSTLFVA